MYCANKEVIKNKICKGKKTINVKKCVVTNKEEFKRKINQNVDYYPFLNNHTIRLKRGWYSFGYGGIYDPEGNRYEMPNFVRYWSPKWLEGYFNVFVPSAIIEWTKSFFGYYAGKNGNSLSPYSSPKIDRTDDLYLELKDPNMEEDGSNSKIIRNKMWKIQHSGNGVFKRDNLKLYAKLDRSPSWEFSDGSLDNFCYYNEKGSNCLSRAWALECETADKIIEQNCRQYTNENACRKERKCERWEE